MGGEAGVESTEGAGSTFWFTARVGLAERKHIDKQAQHEALKGLRVLVVDDNATNRRVLGGQLASCGIKPVCVTTAQDALQALVDATFATSLSRWRCSTSTCPSATASSSAGSSALTTT